MVLSRVGRQHKLKRTIIERSHKTTLRLVSGGREESGPASSPFGPVRAGLTTTPRTNEDQVLTELLNSLEREIIELSIKSCEVLNTLIRDTKPLVKHTSSFSSTTTTEYDSI